MSKFKLNQKVVPISKTADGRTRGLESSIVWIRAQSNKQPFLYITREPMEGDYKEYCASDVLLSACGVSGGTGDYFHERDLVDYEEWINQKYAEIHKSRKFSTQTVDTPFIGYIQDHSTETPEPEKIVENFTRFSVSVKEIIDKSTDGQNVIIMEMSKQTALDLIMNLQVAAGLIVDYSKQRKLAAKILHLSEFGDADEE